jgi:hypothetical protein
MKKMYLLLSILFFIGVITNAQVFTKSTNGVYSAADSTAFIGDNIADQNALVCVTDTGSNPVVEQPILSLLQNVYCTTVGIVQGKIVNMPNPNDSITVTVYLNGHYFLPVSADGYFSFNLNSLAPGHSNIAASFIKATEYKTTHHLFEMSPPVAPSVDLRASLLNSTGLIRLYAVNSFHGGTMPSYAFAYDREFNNLLQNQGHAIADIYNTSLPIGLNWFYVRLTSNSPCATVLTNIDSLVIPIPEIPLLGGLRSSYCALNSLHTINVLNIPPFNYHSNVQVRINHNFIHLTNNHFRINPALLGPGYHTITVTYSNPYITRQKTFGFTVEPPISPTVSLTTTSTQTDGSGILTLQANATNVGNSTPFYTFSYNRSFTRLLNPEGSGNQETVAGSTLTPGSTYMYVKLRSTETCVTRNTYIDSVLITKSGTLNLADNAGTISVFPNPFIRELFFSGFTRGKQYELVFTSIDGRIIYREKMTGSTNRHRVLLPAPVNGLVLVKVHNITDNKQLGVLKLTGGQ